MARSRPQADPDRRREPLAAPSPLIEANRDALRAAATRGPLVELACGRGRIALAVARLGAAVIGIDRSPAFLAELRERARAEGLPVAPVRADLESGRGLPLAPGRAGALLVFRYLHRPLAREIATALRPGGLLLYETFTIHQRDLGHGPGNTEFLLRDGELPRLFPELVVVAHWEGIVDGERPSAVARLVARRP